MVVVLGAGHACSPISGWCELERTCPMVAHCLSYATEPTVPAVCGAVSRGHRGRVRSHGTGGRAVPPRRLSTGGVDKCPKAVENPRKAVHNPVDTAVDNHTIALVSTR
ncbi:hypothetical protein KCH_39250 [Kitasatospora cheerisanensis KCTC 2395]|uniref:Uncharacterized protein n=1 Tax=Kitasatospora cheerisanensis KCTC 2395 TaxID=1348663 RepID=A0A066YVX1_9ACTN|nr:hypothetical protein KCH_39250 [Kitasatospora cheerisanensis KCTC 2395]